MFGKLGASTRKKLTEHGTAAPATVLEIADRGMSVTMGSDSIVSNTEVVLKTRLRVEPPGQPAFEVFQKFRYPQLSIPSAGATLSVRFDPDDHDKLMIDRGAVARPASLTGAPGAGGGTPPFGGGMVDLGSILATVQEARANGGGDPNAVAAALRSSFGGQDINVIDATGLHGAAAPRQESPDDELIEHLERLATLHDRGVLTDAEFTTQKTKLLSGS